MKMTNDIQQYIEQHSEAEPEYLQAISRQTYVRLLNPRMVSGALQGRVLTMLCALLQPQCVLELGTFVGYSALCMAESLGENAVLHTIEADDELEDTIRENLATVAHGSKIVLHIGDALQTIEKLKTTTFDLVFIDADKREYLQYYEAVLPLVRQGGVILADNTLWNGKIFEDVQKNDLQTQKILKFNEFIAKDQRIEKIILPLRDGLTIIRKK
ncbi:MAG: O-methyltransferase [Prevotellaceae bacterium]|nr:O-methyltransferase [Prevotellaceae bacterium]